MVDVLNGHKFFHCHQEVKSVCPLLESALPLSLALASAASAKEMQAEALTARKHWACPLVLLGILAHEEVSPDHPATTRTPAEWRRRSKPSSSSHACPDRRLHNQPTELWDKLMVVLKSLHCGQHVIQRTLPAVHVVVKAPSGKGSSSLLFPPHLHPHPPTFLSS